MGPQTICYHWPHYGSHRPYVVNNLPFCVTSPHAFQVISILYYNPTMMLTLLEKTHVASSPEPITTQFFTQWLKDADLYGG